MKNLQSSKVENREMKVKLIKSLIISFLLFALVITGSVTNFIPKGQANLTFETKQEANEEDIDLSAATDLELPSDWIDQLSTIGSTSITSSEIGTLNISTSYSKRDYLLGTLDTGISVYYRGTAGLGMRTITLVNRSGKILAPMDCSYIFGDLGALTSISFTNFDTSTAIIMNSMFDGTSNIKSIDVSSFDTSNVTNMACMFLNCVNLQSITFGNNFKTNSVTDMQSMFRGCESLTSLDLSNFNMGKITNVSDGNMFNGCTSLTTINAPLGVVASNIALPTSNTWYDSNNGYKIITSLPTKLSSSHTLISAMPSFEVTLDANGGSVSATSNTYQYGETVTLPTPTRDGYVFKGWYTKFDGSNYVAYDQLYKYTDKISVHLSAYKNSWTNDYGRLISCTESGGWNIEAQNGSTSDTVDCYVQFTGYDSGVGYKVATSSIKYKELSAGWHDFDLVFDGSYLYGYIDGVQVAKSEKFTSGKIGYNSSNGILLGAEATADTTTADSSVNKFIGKIENVVILNQDTRISSEDAICKFTMPNQDVTLVAEWLRLGELPYIWRSEITSSTYINQNGISPISNCTTDIESVVIDSTIPSGFISSNYAGKLSTDISVYIKNAIRNSGLKDIAFVYQGGVYAPENSGGLFGFLNNVKIIKFNNFLTSDVTNMSNMFIYDYELLTLDLSCFDTSNVTSIDGMFYQCENLKYLDMSSFDLSNVKSFDNTYPILAGCEPTYIKTPKILTSVLEEKIELESDWYVNLETGEEDPAWFPVTTGTSSTLIIKNTLPSTWFSLIQTQLSNISLKETDITEICFSNSNIADYIVDANLTNYKVDSIYVINSTDPSLSTRANYMILKYNSGYKLVFFAYETYAPEDSTSLFSGLTNLKSIKFDTFNTSKVTAMSQMFYNCNSLTSLNFSNFNTSNVTNMVQMFYDCSSLTNLDVSMFNTSNIKAINGIFSGCSNITSLDLSSFDLSNLESSNNSISGGHGTMFANCTSLVSIKFGDKFCPSRDSSIVGNMSAMFNNCSSLTSLDLSKFNTSHVKYMRVMFNNCSNLTEIILGDNFSTISTINMSTMFNGCSKLTNLNLSKFDMTNVTTATNMLTNCTSLNAIYSPMNVAVSVALPTGSTWYDYNDYSIRTTFPIGLSESHTLKTTALSFNIIIDNNNGSGSSISSNKYDLSSSAQTLTITNPTRTGYTFSGWSVAWTDSVHSETLPTIAGTTLTIPAGCYGNITLTATWNANKYTNTLNYDANGGSNAPSAQTQEVTYPNTQCTFTILSDEPTRQYYTFAGWYTQANGGSKVGSTYTVGSNNVANNQSVTIYAHWTPVEFTITYDYAGGSVSSANKTTYTIESSTFTLTNPTKSGYTFAGWTGTGLSSITTIVTITKGSVGDRAYTANWTANKYTNTLNYDANGGSNAPSAQTQEVTYPNTQSTFTVSSDEPTREGYTFAGWFTDKNGNVTVGSSYTVGNNNVASNQSATIYAHWTPVEYTITYDYAGGTANNVNTYTIETATFTLNAPTKENATFVGYTGSNGTTPQTVVTITRGSTGNKNYTAHWIYSQIKPTAKSGLVYNGLEQVGIENNSNVGFDLISGQDKAINAGNYTATFKLKDGYVWEDNTTTDLVINFTISKKNLNIKADNKNIIFGESAPVYTFSANGFVNNETVDNLTGSIAYEIKDSSNETVVITTSSNVGAYTIIPSGFSSNNYEITYVNGTLTISRSRAVISLSKETESVAYGETTTFTISFDGDGNINVTSGNNLALEVSRLENLVTVKVIAYSETPVEVVVSATAGQNYAEAESKTFTLTTLKRQLEVTSLGDTKTYDGTELTKQQANVTIGSLASFNDLLDEITFDFEGTITNFGEVDNIFTAKITRNDVDITNYYEITYIYGKLSITKAELLKPTNLTVDSYGKVTFDGVVGATGYEISVNNSLFTTCIIGNEYNDLITAVAGEREVKVRAVSTDANYESTGNITSTKVMVYTLTLNKKVDKKTTYIYSKNYINGRTIDINIEIGKDDKFIEWIVDGNGDKPLDSKSNNTSLTITKNTTITAKVEMASNTTVSMIIMICSMIALGMIIAVVTIITIKNKKKKKRARINRIILNR